MFRKYLVAVAVIAMMAAQSWAENPYSSCSTCNTAPYQAAIASCASCQHFHCPTYSYCAEGAPHIHISEGCGKPVCNPCGAPNWGYFQTCWTPWPWPQDLNHCPVMPPAAMVPTFQTIPSAPLAMPTDPSPIRNGGL